MLGAAFLVASALRGARSGPAGSGPSSGRWECLAPGARDGAPAR